MFPNSNGLMVEMIPHPKVAGPPSGSGGQLGALPGQTLLCEHPPEWKVLLRVTDLHPPLRTPHRRGGLRGSPSWRPRCSGQGAQPGLPDPPRGCGMEAREEGERPGGCLVQRSAMLSWGRCARAMRKGSACDKERVPRRGRPSGQEAARMQCWVPWGGGERSLARAPALPSGPFS